jgi:hypothetical protein
MIVGATRGILEIPFAVNYYVTPELAVVADVEFAMGLSFHNTTYMAVGGMAIMTGIEAVPITHREKSGLYFNLLGGVYNFYNFCFTANTGYQLCTKGGFVFTPAVGLKYDLITQALMLNIMLDIGFAF